VAAALLAMMAGRARHAAATPGTAPSARVQPAVVLLLDTNSEDAEAPSRIAAERQAALRYLAALPAGTPVGLITFSDRWQLVVPPGGQDLTAAALAAVHPAGPSSTGLTGGLSAATAALGNAGATAGGRLLVLSDGEDLGGHLRAPSVPTDVVTWQSDGDDRAAALRALALAAGGHTASPGQAAALAAALTRAPAVAESSRARPLALMGVLASVFAALLAIGLLVSALARRDRRGRLLTERIASYGAHAAPAAAEEDGTLASTAIGLVGRLLRSGRTEQRLSNRLDLAGIARKPAEWVLLGGIAGVLLAAVLTLATGSLPIGLLGGALLAWAGMRLLVSVRIARRRTAFADQLPDMLQLVAGSLLSGFSLAQGLDAVVRDGAKPASGEFARALSQARIGVDLTDALQRVADRMNSVDLRWTVMAIRIQREVGGHLAEVLNTTVGTMRERSQLRRHVKALSAEGRLSAYILVALPVLIGGWLFIGSPGYVRPLYTTTVGIVMLALAAVLTAVGALWMRKVIKVEM
jgi:tight adherence protein B